MLTDEDLDRIAELFASLSKRAVLPYEIQRQLVFTQLLPTIPFAASAIIVPADPNRVSLLIASSGPNALHVQTGGTVTNTQGIVLNPGVSVLDINIADHGALVQQQWVGIAITANQPSVVLMQTWHPVG